MKICSSYVGSYITQNLQVRESREFEELSTLIPGTSTLKKSLHV